MGVYQFNIFYMKKKKQIFSPVIADRKKWASLKLSFWCVCAVWQQCDSVLWAQRNGNFSIFFSAYAFSMIHFPSSEKIAASREVKFPHTLLLFLSLFISFSAFISRCIFLIVWIQSRHFHFSMLLMFWCEKKMSHSLSLSPSLCVFFVFFICWFANIVYRFRVKAIFFFLAAKKKTSGSSILLISWKNLFGFGHKNNVCFVVVVVVTVVGYFGFNS